MGHTASHEPSYGTSERPASRRILLVEDDKSLLRMVQRGLTAAGHDVVAFSEFQAARNYLALNPTDVIVTDIRLGDFNGLQLVVVAKRAHPEIQALVMTGFDDRGVRGEVERIGAQFVAKPVAVSDLLLLLD